MYRTAVKKITEGLSPLGRFLLGAFSALFGVMIMMSAGSKDPFIVWMISLFCFAIAVVSVTWGRVRQFVGSLVGTALFCMGLMYLCTEITGRQLFSSQGETSVLNAVLFLSFIGIPGIAYAVKARFGLQKKAP